MSRTSIAARPQCPRDVPSGVGVQAMDRKAQARYNQIHFSVGVQDRERTLGRNITAANPSAMTPTATKPFCGFSLKNKNGTATRKARKKPSTVENFMAFQCFKSWQR